MKSNGALMTISSPSVCGQMNLDVAIQRYSEAIQINPKLAEAHNILRGALLSTGQAAKNADAEKEFKTASALDPHNADAEDNLGTLFGQEGDDADGTDVPRQRKSVVPAGLVNLAATLASESRFCRSEHRVAAGPPDCARQKECAATQGFAEGSEQVGESLNVSRGRRGRHIRPLDAISVN